MNMIATALDYDEQSYLLCVFNFMANIKKFKNHGLQLDFLPENIKGIDEDFLFDAFFEVASKALNAKLVSRDDSENNNDDQSVPNMPHENDLTEDAYYDECFVLSIPLENGLTKDDILEAYQNSSLIICDCIEREEALLFLWHDECSYRMKLSGLLSFIFHLELRRAKTNGSNI